jgi:hypothetical protein
LEVIVVGDIEVGANGDELAYWQAKEAMRHAEMRLSSQAATLSAFEARATSILGWIVAVLTTIAGAATVALSNSNMTRALALGAVFVPAAITVYAASRGVWPKRWCVPGFEPAEVMSECENELQQIKALAFSYGAGIRDNAKFLEIASDNIRRAWWGLVLTPLTGIVAVVIAWAAGG